MISDGRLVFDILLHVGGVNDACCVLMSSVLDVGCFCLLGSDNLHVLFCFLYILCFCCAPMNASHIFFGDFMFFFLLMSAICQVQFCARRSAGR